MFKFHFIFLFIIGFCLPLFTSCEKSEHSEPDLKEAATSPETQAQHAPAKTPSAELPSEVTFNEHVQPILSEYCYHCHGPDSNTRFPKDDPLRLDIEDEAFAHRSNSKLQPIVKGDPAASNIIRLMKLPQGHEEVMPPKEAHKTMEAHEIAIIEKWIEQGSEYQKHWSFISPEKKEPTPLKTIPSDWVKNPIDAYTAAKMEEHGLTPNPESDPARLLRRLSLDITGLPPYSDELENFKKAHAADPDKAISDAVDVMLASDGYAENMARHWLDAARYADTHGIHQDNYRSIWPYRDWVIKAFRENMPFDQFTIEQIAGDMLPNATLDQKIATGFSRCLPTTGEGGAIPEEYEAIYAQDRTDTTAAIYLGMTMGCAACHDHKFDPISQKDTYSFNAFFRNSTMRAMDQNLAEHPPTIFTPHQADKDRYFSLLRELKTKRNEISQLSKKHDAEFKTWLAQQGTSPISLTPETTPQVSIPLTVKDGQTAITFKDGTRSSVPYQGNTVESPLGAIVDPYHSKHSFPHVAFSPDQQISFSAMVRTEKGPHGPVFSTLDPKNKDRGWEFQIRYGQIIVRIIDEWPAKAIKANTETKIARDNKWQHIMVTYNGKVDPKDSLTIYINGKPQAIRYEKFGSPENITNDLPLLFGRRHKGDLFSNKANIYGFEMHERLFTDAQVNLSLNRVNHSLLTAPEKRSKQDEELLRNYYFANIHSGGSSRYANLVELEKEEYQLRLRGSQSLIMQERKSKPFAHILVRGEYSNKANKVSAAVPEVLPPLPEGAPKNRLGLAKWLVDKNNPLSARVNMNRFWYYFFGEGIVTSTADFGIMGARPSHPKLLDYLAVEFMDSGWDIRHMVKLITTCNTYRQSQVVTEQKKKLDGPNTYLARGPRYRLDAEQIRDTALFASGLLSKEIGGPPVKPYQPEGVWEAVAMEQSNTRFYKQDQGNKLYRRSLYSFWKRSAPMANMEILNAPAREVFCVRRDRTNTPLQAFVTLNDVQFIEASRNLAQQALLREKDFDTRIDHITNTLLARTLNDEEKTIVKTNLEENIAHYAKNQEAATALITQGESKPNTADLNTKDLAAWTITASQIFNLDENLNK